MVSDSIKKCDYKTYSFHKLYLKRIYFSYIYFTTGTVTSRRWVISCRRTLFFYGFVGLLQSSWSIFYLCPLISNETHQKYPVVSKSCNGHLMVRYILYLILLPVFSRVSTQLLGVQWQTTCDQTTLTCLQIFKRCYNWVPSCDYQEVFTYFHYHYKYTKHWTCIFWTLVSILTFEFSEKRTHGFLLFRNVFNSDFFSWSRYVR